MSPLDKQTEEDTYVTEIVDVYAARHPYADEKVQCKLDETRLLTKGKSLCARQNLSRSFLGKFEGSSARRAYW